MPRNYKTPQQHREFAEGIKAGKTLQDAMLDAGYSDKTARKGRAALTGPMKKALADVVSAEFANMVELGRTIKPEQMRHAVLGGLALNVAERTDKGTNALKLAGSLKELQMYQPDSVAGIVVLELPKAAAPMVIEAGDVKLME